MPATLPFALFELLSLASNAAFGAAPRPERASEIRTLVEERIDVKGPGVAILVSQHGVPLHLAGYGMADVKSGTSITPDSLFDLASVSKQMTGVAILTLVEKGTLKLDQPVARYVQDFAVPVKGRPVTVADLLHHVSGLADYTGDDWDGSDAEFASLTPETHLKWLNGTRARRAPGLKYEYDNSGYVLLALIVERLSGQSFAKYLEEHLFAPAGMKHTVILDGTAKLPKQTVKGYVTNDKGQIRRSSLPTVITGDGNVYTSIRDLALWDKALRDHTIIGEPSQKLAWTNGRHDNGKPISNEDGDGYGFGWVIEKKRSRTISHSGSWNGTASYLLLDLREGFTIAVLSNDEKADVGDLAEEALTLFKGGQPITPACNAMRSIAGRNGGGENARSNMKINSLRICLSLALAWSAVQARESFAADPGGKRAFVFGNVAYFHRWSKNDQHEFTPEKQEDLAKWSDMLTINGYPRVNDGDGLAETASAVLENYKSHQARVLKTRSVPRAADRPAEHLITVIFTRPSFSEVAFARFKLMEGKGCSLVYSHRIYGEKTADEMSAWVDANGAEVEKTLMEWSSTMPSPTLLRSERL